MNTKHISITMGILVIVLFTSACGGAAATEAPTYREAPAEPAAPARPAATGAPFYAEEPERAAPALSGQDQAYAPAQPIAPNKSRYPEGNQPYDMFFEDYGVNPSIDTEDDHLSTFALDRKALDKNKCG